MVKLLWRFGLLILAAIGFAWLADRPGSIVIRWLGREIEMSFIIAVALLLASVLALMFVLGLFRKLWRTPATTREYLRFRKTRKGYESLSRGIIAAGAGDAQSAQRHAATAGNNLSDEPLVNVLAAQAAQLRGDRPAVKRIFEAMAADKETEAMGLRGLFAEASQARNISAAKTYAERALTLNPRLTWAAAAMLQIQTKQKNWTEALETLTKQIKAGTVPTTEGEIKQAALYAALALAQEETDPTEAMNNALKALKRDPALVPAALVAARRMVATGKTKKAMAILREAWRLAPHPHLAEIMAHAKPGDGPEARFERVRDLVGDKTTDLEPAIALATSAVAAGRFDVARDTLAPFSADQPQSRVCALLADIAEGTGDKGRSREWLARAIHAPRDPLWVSDGVASPRWTPVSPITGEIIPCQWKSPFDLDQTPLIAAPVTSTNTALAAPKPPTMPALKPEAITILRAPDDPGPDPFDLNGDIDSQAR